MKLLGIIIIVAAVTSTAVVLTLKAFGVNDTGIAGGVSGGVTGALCGSLAARKRK